MWHRVPFDWLTIIIIKNLTVSLLIVRQPRKNSVQSALWNKFALCNGCSQAVADHRRRSFPWQRIGARELAPTATKIVAFNQRWLEIAAVAAESTDLAVVAAATGQAEPGDRSAQHSDHGGGAGIDPLSGRRTRARGAAGLRTKVMESWEGRWLTAREARISGEDTE